VESPLKAQSALLLLLALAPPESGSAGTAPEERPVYEVLRTSQPIQIDGILNDAAWVAAPMLGPFLNNRDGSPSPLKTEARVLYDDQFLYFASRFEDENIWATMKNRDEHLWTEEVFEVFLRPDLQYKSYIELEVNPLNALIDIYLLDVRNPLHYEGWNSEKIAWAVQVDGTVDGKGGDRGWSCELALPMEDIVPAPNIPPKPGDRWMLNLYRVESKPQKAALAWSPTYRNDFHTPDKFGVIVFSDKQVP